MIENEKWHYRAWEKHQIIKQNIVTQWKQSVDNYVDNVDNSL